MTRRTLFLRTPRGVVLICGVCRERLRVTLTTSYKREVLGHLTVRCGCDRRAA